MHPFTKAHDATRQTGVDSPVESNADKFVPISGFAEFPISVDESEKISESRLVSHMSQSINCPFEAYLAQ